MTEEQRKSFLESIGKLAEGRKNLAMCDMQIERTLLGDPRTEAFVKGVDGELRQRQRDHAVMLRLTQMIGEAFDAGGDWLSVHRRLRAFEEAFKVRNDALDGQLAAAVRTVEKGV